MDAKIYLDAKNLLESGKTILETEQRLLSKGYLSIDIRTAFKEIFNDNKSGHNKKLVKEIEKRFSKGELMQDIIEDLVKKGNKSFDVEKALLISHTGNERLVDSFRHWKLYSILQIGALISTIFVTIFYNVWFFLGMIAILSGMMISTMKIPEKNKQWITEVSAMPYAGLTVTNGFFGYNSVIGNYFRWWTIDPEITVGLFFLSFGIFFSFVFGATFFSIAILIGAISFLGFFLRPKDPWDTRSTR